jgi:O-antigen ligase
MSGFLNRGGFVYSSSKRLGDERGPQAAYVVVAAAAASSIAGAALAELPLSTATAVTVAAVVCGLLAVVRVVLRPSPSLPAAVALRPPAPSRRFAVAQTSIESRLLAVARTTYYLGAATIGLLTIRPALLFTLSDWLFLIALGITVLAILRRGDGVGVDLPPLLLAGAALFAIGGLVSSVHAVSPLGSAAIVVRMLYLTIPWFWLGTVLLRTPRQVRYAVTAWVVSAAISGAGALAQFFLGDVLPGSAGDVVAHGRATGFTDQYNQLGGLTAIAFAPALVIAARSRGRARLFTVPLVALIGAGVVLSGSVGGFLAAAVATAVYLFASGRARGTLALVGALIVAAFLLFGSNGGSNSTSPFERLSKVTRSDEPRARGGTLYSRIDTYRAAWAHIREDPFEGVGLDAASSIDRIGFEVHNVVLLPWYTAGVLGFLGIWILIASLFSVGFRVVGRARSPDERLLALSLYASFIAFVVFAMSEPILFVRYGWAPVGFLLALRVQQRGRRHVDA